MPLATAPRRRARVAGDDPGVPLDRARTAWFPASPRRSRPALAAAGVLVVLVCAAGGAALAGRQDRGQPYLALARSVPVGMPLTSGDLTTVEVGPDTGLTLVPAAAEAAVLGKRASAPLQAGTLLDPGALAVGAPVPSGDAVVGASLQPEQLPAELQPGDAVMVVLTGTSSAAGAAGSPSPASSAATSRAAPQPGEVLADATALEVVAPAGSGPVTSGSAGAATLVDLAVPLAAAAEVTAASAAGQVSLALVGRPSTPGRQP